MNKKKLARLLAATGAATLASSAFAVAPTTVGELASSVNFTDVGVAILGVAGVVITLYVLWKGAQFVIKAVRGA